MTIKDNNVLYDAIISNLLIYTGVGLLWWELGIKVGIGVFLITLAIRRGNIK